MSYQHSSLAAGRWRTLTLMEQLANVGSEIERTMGWRRKHNSEYSRQAFERGLELLELTIADPRHRLRLRELTRLREVLLDYFMGPNEYGSTEAGWSRYFLPYALAARNCCPPGSSRPAGC